MEETQVAEVTEQTEEAPKVEVEEVISVLVPVSVSLKHKDCGGDLVMTGVAFLSNPAQYEYVCNKCGAKANAPAQYPKLDYITQEQYQNALVKPEAESAPEVEVVE